MGNQWFSSVMCWYLNLVVISVTCVVKEVNVLGIDWEWNDKKRWLFSSEISDCVYFVLITALQKPQQKQPQKTLFGYIFLTCMKEWSPWTALMVAPKTLKSSKEDIFFAQYDSKKNCDTLRYFNLDKTILFLFGITVPHSGYNHFSYT